MSELYDVEITAETMTRQVAENRLEREAALKVTIVKNKVRGYYKNKKVQALAKKTNACTIREVKGRWNK